MVRRIIPDSDFETDEEAPDSTPCVLPADGSTDTAPSSLADVDRPPPSAKRVIRQKDLPPKSVGTYTYDSDIYTEESSMGSFIVYSNDENDDQLSDKDSGIRVF